MKKYIVKCDIHDVSVLKYIEALESSHITGKPLWYAILEKVGKRKQTHSLVEQAIKKVTYDSTPESFQNKRWFPILKVIGKRYMTYKICAEAVSHNGFNLRFVPKEYLTKEICMLALLDNGGCLSYVPEDMRTYDLCDMAVTHDVYYGNAIENVPPSIIKSNPNNRWYEKAVIATGNAIRFIPANKITDEIAYIVMAHILNDSSNDDYFDDVAISKDICAIPTKYITKEFINSLIKSKPTCARHLWAKQTFSAIYPELCEEATKMFVLNSRDDGQGNRCDAPKIDRGCFIYYISDIHLEHQFELSKSKSLNYEELSHRLCEMLEPVMQRPGICLFGGDIADSAELESTFFREAVKISNNRKCEFVIVLGNHELWNGNPFLNMQYESVDSVIDAYREIIPQQVILLENAMYLKYGKFEIPIVIEEPALLNLSNDDLRAICKSSSALILGGIGFSGFETRFNGAHGLYGMLVDAQEDAKQTKRFQKVYEKLLSVANDIPIVVLTHTPITYWTNVEPNSKWIYISGHTHQNKMLGKNLFCDNQVGYKPKRWMLKSIDIESFFKKRDCSYSDGIHKITSKEYDDLISQRGLWAPHLKSDGNISVLKWQEYLMFVLENNGKYFLLDGGKKLKLPNDVAFYMYQLPKYISNLNSIYKNHWYIISKISQEVKCIGGSGKKHGCIIDIDAYHHIYYNPFDGIITPYFALNTTSKITYSNLTQLIKETPYKQIRSYQNSKTIEELYEQAISENKIPFLMKGMALNVGPAKFVSYTGIYPISEYFLKLQYFFENKIIRIWDDRILSAKPSEIQNL